MNFFSPRLLRQIGRWLLIIISLYLIGWLVVNAGSAVTPFIFGGVLAYLFLPLVNFFNAGFRAGWQSWLSIC